MVTEAELDAFIEQAHSGSNMPRPPWSRSFYREQLEAGQRHSAQVRAKTAEAQEIKQLRERVAKLERMVLGKNAVLLKVVGTALGRSRREIEDRVKVIEDREPVPLPLPNWNNPTVHYCGLWNSANIYGPRHGHQGWRVLGRHVGHGCGREARRWPDRLAARGQI